MKFVTVLKIKEKWSYFFGQVSGKVKLHLVG